MIAPEDPLTPKLLNFWLVLDPSWVIFMGPFGVDSFILGLL
jgi:hypothetical protein